MTIKQKQLLLAFMDCLSVEDVDSIWGPQSAAATAAAQRKLDIPADGVWGEQTDDAVREYIYSGGDLIEEPAETGTFWDHIRYWSRGEFRCRCGEYHAPYCDGFPAEPDQTLVELLDDVREHFGSPGHRSSGIRCKQHNADSGGVYNSRHLSGKAMDFMIEGVSAERVRAYAASDPRCNYTYVIGNGPYVHVDVK